MYNIIRNVKYNQKCKIQSEMYNIIKTNVWSNLIVGITGLWQLIGGNIFQKYFYYL